MTTPTFTKSDIDDLELVDSPDAGWWACIVSLKDGRVFDMCEIFSTGGYEGLDYSTLRDMSGPTPVDLL